MGSRLLTSALDNTFFLVKLTQSVELVEAGESLDYEIQMNGGEKDVALWTKKSTADNNTLFQVDGVPMASSPRLQINFK